MYMDDRDRKIAEAILKDIEKTYKPSTEKFKELVKAFTEYMSRIFEDGYKVSDEQKKLAKVIISTIAATKNMDYETYVDTYDDQTIEREYKEFLQNELSATAIVIALLSYNVLGQLDPKFSYLIQELIEISKELDINIHNRTFYN